MTGDWSTSRRAFQEAADWFESVVERVVSSGAPLGGPGLGDWSLRDLIGHTSRALVTVCDYVDPVHREVAGWSTADYFRLVRESRADPGAVAERGREAGRLLEDDPVGGVRGVADRAWRVVMSAASDTLVSSPVGPLSLEAYLPTRTFELVVHTGDILEAAHGSGVPGVIRSGAPAEALAEALRVTGLLLPQLPAADGETVLRALTGREALARGISVF